jgi:hypothetical protein
MGDIGQLVGRPVNGTDVIPKWDKAVELLGSQAIIVYPQSLGDPGTGVEAVDGQGDKYRQVRCSHERGVTAGESCGQRQHQHMLMVREKSTGRQAAHRAGWVWQGRRSVNAGLACDQQQQQQQKQHLGVLR